MTDELGKRWSADRPFNDANSPFNIASYDTMRSVIRQVPAMPRLHALGGQRLTFTNNNWGGYYWMDEASHAFGFRHHEIRASLER